MVYFRSLQGNKLTGKIPEVIGLMQALAVLWVTKKLQFCFLFHGTHFRLVIIWKKYSPTALLEPYLHGANVYALECHSMPWLFMWNGRIYFYFVLSIVLCERDFSFCCIATCYLFICKMSMQWFTFYSIISLCSY